jgi:hypothetical protein
MRVFFTATALAAYYAFRHPEPFRRIYWIDTAPTAFIKASALTGFLMSLIFVAMTFFVDVGFDR